MPDQNNEDKRADQGEIPDVPPEVLPVQTIQQPALGATTGLAAFAKNKPEDVNDEDSHVEPTDNDGETVPS